MTLTRYILCIFLVLAYSLKLDAQVDPAKQGNTQMGVESQSNKEAGNTGIKKRGTRPMPPNPELFKRQEFEFEQEVQVREKVEKVEEPENFLSTWRVLTLGFTATGYVGDLNYTRGGESSVSQFSLHPGLDLSFRKDAPKTILPVFRIGYGKYSAQGDNIIPVRYEYEGGDSLITPNNYAESILIYGEFTLRLSPFPKSLRIKPYFEGGIGGQSFFPRAQDGILLFRKRSTRAPDELEYGSFMLYFPLSVGLDYQISTSLNLQLAYTFKTLGSDYIDNIGNLGDKIGNDQLHVFRVGLGFRFEDYKKGRKAYR